MMYSPFRHIGSVLWKRNPIHLTVFLTRRCNARCPFCFYLRAAGPPPQPQPELSLDELERVSRSLGPLLWLAFSGGEIYLREDLVEISRAFYRNNRPAIMLFPTNGLLPELIRDRTEQILKSCVKSVITVKLSLDGLGETHDALRDSPGSVEKTMQTYRLLGPLLAKYPHFELGVNTVFLSGNQDRMDEIIDFVKGMENVRTHTISLVRGSLSDERCTIADPGKYFRAVERLEKNLRDGSSPTYRFRGARVKTAQDILQRRLIHRTVLERKRLIPCYAGRLNLVLTENGGVYPCEILNEGMGNVRDHRYDLRAVLRSAKAKTVLREIRNNGCYCTHECVFLTNILFNPRLYPALALEYMRHS